MFNKTILMGRITHDLELKTTQNGTSVCHFQMAVDRRYQTKGEEKKTDFFRIVAWRQTAEFITRYFRKGSMILVEGELQTGSYTDKNGNSVNAVEVVVDQVSFTGEKKDDNTAMQGYPASAENYQQPPQNYQPAAPAPTQPAPNYQAQYGAAAPNYQSAQNYQQAADMAAIAAKYAGAAAAAPPPAPAAPVQQPTPPQKAAKGADVYPF